MWNLLAVFGALAVLRCPGAEAWPGLGLEGWTAQAGSARLEPLGDGLLRVSYADAERRPVRIAPAVPVPLPDDIKTLSLWFARIEGDFSLLFNIRDAAGGLHDLKVNTSRLPHGGPVGWQQSRAREWSRWNQAESWRLNTPADIRTRALPEFRAATEALVWPRPLSLAGITIKPAAGPGYDAADAARAVKAGAGNLLLGELKVSRRNGFEAGWAWTFPGRGRWGRDAPLFLFLDDLTSDGGEVRYEVEVRRGYQGPVVWRRRGAGDAGLGDAAGLFRRRIVLPELPCGRYFLTTKTWKPDGSFDAARTLLEWIVLQNKNAPAAPSPATDDDEAFEWMGDRPHHVFPNSMAEAALRIPLSAALRSRLPVGATVHVRVVDYENRTVLRQDFPPAEEVRVAVPVESGMEYFATAELFQDGRMLDRAQLHFGVESAPEPAGAGKVPDTVPDRDTALDGNVHYNAEYWEGDRPSRVFPWVNNLEPEEFERFLDQAVRAGAKSVSIGDLWGNHEMLPGVYQWRELDRRIARAGSHGLKVFLAYTADGSEGRKFPFPPWLEAAPRLDQAGDSPARVFNPSWWDPAVREGWLRYYRRLALHVRENPVVIGYRISNYELSGKTAGWGVDPFRLDYSAPARAEFARWAAERERVGGADADPEMGVLFSLPGVLEKDLPGPDLSPAFRNFVDFSTYSHHARLADFFATIRAVDDRRQIQVDQKPFSYAVEASLPLLRDGGVLKNEDSPTFNAAALRSMAVQAGVAYAEELHNHMPTSRSIADATNFWSSYLSDGLFWLMRWHSRMIVPVEELPSGGGFSQKTAETMLDYQRETMPAWEEWIRARVDEPEVVVFGSRAQGLLGNWRTGGDYDIEGIRTFAALFGWHQVPPHFANEYTDWVRLDRFNVVFVCGPIQSWRALERIAGYARSGGKVVLVGEAGKYCPEKPLERDLLRRMLADIPGADFREIAEPRRQGSAGVPEWQAPYGFAAGELEALLNWAGVERRVAVKGGSADGREARFECQARIADGGDRVYVAVMRKWTGGYDRNIEYESALKKKYGLAGGTVTVGELGHGVWRLEKIHRESKDRGVLTVVNRAVTFDLDESLAGEVQLFRLTRMTEPGSPVVAQ